MLDIHSHILFGVDDGAKSLRESEAMLRAARNVGIDRIVATPHCRWDSFDRGKVEAHFDIVSERAHALGIEMHLGYEVNWRKIPEFGYDEICTMNISGTDLFLLEFSDDVLPANWKTMVRAIQERGLRVIIAHPERNAAIQRDIERAFELKEAGCLLQLSANFVGEGRLSARRKAATALLKEGLVDYVASDAHAQGDYGVFANALRFAQRF